MLFCIFTHAVGCFWGDFLQKIYPFLHHKVKVRPFRGCFRKKKTCAVQTATKIWTLEIYQWQCTTLWYHKYGHETILTSLTVQRVRDNCPWLKIELPFLYLGLWTNWWLHHWGDLRAPVPLLLTLVMNSIWYEGAKEFFLEGTASTGCQIQWLLEVTCFIEAWEADVFSCCLL
jgi:hypothetical protein